MKRDMDLIRELLTRVEAHVGPRFLSDSDVTVDGYTADQVREHFFMLEDAGLVEGKAIHYMDGDGGGQFLAKKLTWDGHEFIANARNDTIWNKSKEKVAAAGGSVSIATMSELMGSVAKGLLGL
jgi:hypothetical protein